MCNILRLHMYADTHTSATALPIKTNPVLYQGKTAFSLYFTPLHKAVEDFKRAFLSFLVHIKDMTELLLLITTNGIIRGNMQIRLAYNRFENLFW